MEQGRRQQPVSARSKRAIKRRQRTHHKQNKAGMLCITGIVLFLLVAMSTQIYSLYNKNQVYEEKKKQLTAQLESEQERQEEIAAYEQYVTTPEYIEQLAKTKLGLVYSNEIIFKEQNSEN